MATHLKRMVKSIDTIIHEVNVAQSIDCNPRARYHIQKNCIIIHNKAIIKYNDLKEWIAGNKDASIEEIQIIISKIDAGEDVRGFEFEVEVENKEYSIHDTLDFKMTRLSRVLRVSTGRLIKFFIK